jgi:tryptophanase
LLPDLDEARRGKVLAAVNKAFEVHVSGDAARFTAACWLIRARNSG